MQNLIGCCSSIGVEGSLRLHSVHIVEETAGHSPVHQEVREP